MKLDMEHITEIHETGELMQECVECTQLEDKAIGIDHSLQCLYVKKLNEKLKALTLKVFESQQASSTLNEKLYSVKLLRSKATVILNENKEKYNEYQKDIKDCHKNYIDIVNDLWKSSQENVNINDNNSNNLDKEISKRITDLKERLEMLNTIVNEERQKKLNKEKELINLKKQISEQRKKKHILSMQLQDTITNMKSACEGAKMQLYSIKINTYDKSQP